MVTRRESGGGTKWVVGRGHCGQRWKHIEENEPGMIVGEIGLYPIEHSL